MTTGTVVRLVIVMVLWASCFPLIALGLDLAPHMAFAALRAAIAGACLLVLGALLRRPVPRGIRSWTLVGLVGLGATTLGFFGMFHAAEFISPGLATVIANTQPLLAAVLAYIVLGERLKVLGTAGMLAGFGGIVAIGWHGLATGAEGYALGIAYVLVAAFGVAAGNVAIKRMGGQLDAVMTMGFQLVLGAIPLGVLSVFTEEVSSIVWSANFVVVLVALAVPGTSLAFWLWFEVLKDVELNRANVFTFLVPVLALGIGALLFGERLDWSQALAVVLVLIGIWLVQR